MNGDRVSSVTLSCADGGPATAVVGSYHLSSSAAVGTGLANYAIHYHDGALTVTSKSLNYSQRGLQGLRRGQAVRAGPGGV